MPEFQFQLVSNLGDIFESQERFPKVLWHRKGGEI